MDKQTFDKLLDRFVDYVKCGGSNPQEVDADEVD
jgi:hypothetical protein